jgi:DNA-directed RNA polymerase subunit RPC12/RpoP
MQQTIKVKCANCGSGLEISAQLEDFECSYCGALLTVNPPDKADSPEPPANAIPKAPPVTDKTAADLATQKLKGELQNIDESIAGIKHKAWLDQTRHHTLCLTIWISLSVGCLVLLAASQQIFLFLLIWAILTGVILYFYKKRGNEIKMNYTNAYDNLVYQAQEIEKRIQKRR